MRRRFFSRAPSIIAPKQGLRPALNGEGLPRSTVSFSRLLFFYKVTPSDPPQRLLFIEFREFSRCNSRRCGLFPCLSGPAAAL